MTEQTMQNVGNVAQPNPTDVPTNGVNNNVEAPTTTPKVGRRGVASARGTTLLTFNNSDAKPNGLFIAQLVDVVVQSVKIGEDTTGLPSFNGLEVPRIRFNFTSVDKDVNKRKYVSLSFMAVESNCDTIPEGKQSWKVDTVFDWIKHILNVYVTKGRELTEEEATKLALPFDDFNDNGEYEPVEVEKVIAGWKYFFDNVATMMNTANNGKPAYIDNNGNAIPVWIKLLREQKSKSKGWVHIANGELAFPTFVGSGCIEVFTPNVAPTISISANKESIEIMDLSKPKAPTALNNPNMPSMGGISVDPTPYADPTGIGLAAAEDMPF